jgi:methyl-accepting chemotaxis protein
MKNKKRISIARKISVIIVLMILVSSVTVGLFSYVLYRNDSVKQGGERALAISQTVAAGIDAEDFVRVMSSGVTDESWQRVKTAADKTTAQTGCKYLYILDANYSDTFTYFAEGYNPESDEEELGFGYQEDASIYSDKMYETLKTGAGAVSDAYKSGDFGTMVSGFAPIIDSTGKVVGVVGADISIEVVMSAANSFGVKAILIVVLCGLVFGLLSILILSNIIGKPITELTRASGQIAEGNLDISLNIKSGDEIGLLAESFRGMIDSTKKQVEILERIADRDLTVEVKTRSEQDAMSAAMSKTVASLNNTLSEIQLGTSQFTDASAQISQGAQGLAMGAATQSSAIESLAETIGKVSGAVRQNADMANHASVLIETIKGNAESGSNYMDKMVEAVDQINKASYEIKKVIKTIDDIAFKTNILALNASVEAARAGQYGKGFAVVAEEVRNLAAKSAESAKETSALIENSLSKTAVGVQIANETSSAFSQIVSGINQSGEIISGIAVSSEEQRNAIGELNIGIDRVSEVVEQNRTTAEQSAAASEELNSQSEHLKGMIIEFKLSGYSGERQQLRGNNNKFIGGKY